jgi:restriction system protein
MTRKKSSPLEDFVELIAMLPWWVGVVTAIILYIFLSSYAAQPAVPITYTPGHPPDITTPIFKGLASMLQYVLPLLALVGAGISLFKGIKRKGLFEAAAGSGQEVLNGITWHEFEMLVGESFRRKGYTVEESGGGGADGGIDLILYKGGEKSLVQCKQWRAYKVGVKVVRELYGVMAASRTSHGYVVTSGRFTADAIKFAEGREIDLIDGDMLNRMIREMKHKLEPVIPAAVSEVQSTGGMVLSVEMPACPKCKSPMEKRSNKAGKLFWGCPQFPRCRGSRSL